MQRQVGRGQIRRFTGNDYTKDLVSGDVLACQAYSGDVIQLQADNPDIRFVVPEEGAELWSDSLMIPNRARHKASAERLIDYYYQPEVAAELAAWVNYVCPVPAAKEVLAADPDKDTAALADNPLIFPDETMRSRLAIARDITSAERVDFARRWNKIVVCEQGGGQQPQARLRTGTGAGRVGDHALVGRAGHQQALEGQLQGAHQGMVEFLGAGDAGAHRVLGPAPGELLTVDGQFADEFGELLVLRVAAGDQPQ